MWKCLKLLRFSIQTTEKLFIAPITFDNNTGFGAPTSSLFSAPGYLRIEVTAGRKFGS